MKTLTAFALLSAATLFASGCQQGAKDCKDDAACKGDCKPSKDAAKNGTVNTMCVMNPSESIADNVSTSYKGMKVGFCCAGCVAKFNALSDADKAARLAKVGVTVK
jgi:hypothetical protein